MLTFKFNPLLPMCDWRSSNLFYSLIACIYNFEPNRVYSILICTSLWGHGNHGGARRVVVADCLVNKNEVRIFNYKARSESLFCVHNVTKETCARTDYWSVDRIWWGAGRKDTAYRSRNFNVKMIYGWTSQLKSDDLLLLKIINYDRNKDHIKF